MPNSFNELNALAFKNWYEEFLKQRFGISELVAYEPPRIVVARLLNSFPEFMDQASGSSRGAATRFSYALMNSPLKTGEVKILGIKLDTIRRQFDGFKKAGFPERMLFYRGWLDADPVDRFIEGGRVV